MKEAPKSDEISVKERQELRSVVRGQYKVLRAEIRQREKQMVSEVEEQMLAQYRQQDHDMQAARKKAKEVERRCARAIERAKQKAAAEMAEVADELSGKHPDLTVRVSEARFSDRAPDLSIDTPKRDAVRRAAMSKIPELVSQALLVAERQEQDLLRSLSESALQSSRATQFLDGIPTVNSLLPRANLRVLSA